jgi:N6-adenosine-specific RNA methylase IME4
MSSSIILLNASSDVILLDIPRSIELAQGHASSGWKLISSKPLENPYPSIEPKSKKSKKNVGELSLDELLLGKRLEFALEEVRSALQADGRWCLRRVVEDGRDESTVGDRRKRRRVGDYPSPFSDGRGHPQHDGKEAAEELSPFLDGSEPIHMHNPHSHPLNITLTPSSPPFTLPPHTTVLQGSISSTLPTFSTSAPRFNAIVLDPPWPNRSARRKKDYSISYGNSDIQDLLSSLPLQTHLGENGLVAVWITNKKTLKDMILGKGGLFEQWDVELVEEWIWLKITASGEPICALYSMWRKPYEILLIGRKRKSELAVMGDENKGAKDVKRRVMIAVPDLHSRKPNLKEVFETLMGLKRGYKGLEIFARNLTEGWWGWGNEVLKFQMRSSWKVVED